MAQSRIQGSPGFAGPSSEGVGGKGPPPPNTPSHHVQPGTPTAQLPGPHLPLAQAGPAAQELGAPPDTSFLSAPHPRGAPPPTRACRRTPRNVVPTGPPTGPPPELLLAPQRPVPPCGVGLYDLALRWVSSGGASAASSPSPARHVVYYFLNTTEIPGLILSLECLRQYLCVTDMLNRAPSAVLVGFVPSACGSGRMS